MERLTRLRFGASPEEKAEFAREFNEVLDRLGVEPGETFLVGGLGGQPRARRGDPDTSHAAARSVDDLRESQKAVLKIFMDWHQSMTDEKLVTRYQRGVLAKVVPPQSESGIRTRRRELADAGFLADTGKVEAMDSGRQAILWALAPDPEPEPEPEREPVGVAAEPQALFDSPGDSPRPGFMDPE